MLHWRYVAIALTVACLLASRSLASVVNVDIEAGVAGDTTHVGADGPLSTPGGTLWTSIVSSAVVPNLPTEFGTATPFYVQYTAFAQPSTFNDPGINNLQDSGDFGQFEIRNLIQGQVYELAVYAGQNGGFNLTDANGSRPFFTASPGADGWSLPGTEGNGGDYFHVTNVQPYEVTPGVWGVQISPDGVITGFQISGPVPEPATVVLLAFALLLAIRRR